MMHEAFVANDFRKASLATIDQANLIIMEYQAQGFVLTLRQLYYQFVARDLIPNSHAEYKKLGSILNKARLAGLIDWSALEDRTRNLEVPSVWDSPRSILSAVADQYQENIWADQPRYVLVLIEKDALLGVIEPICTELRLPYMGCRGHVSQSEMYAIGKRLGRHNDDGKEVLILHLGDHDPSGVHMTDDNQRRLSMFAGCEIDVRRLALNMDQIRRYKPPPNPAKETDTRIGEYVARFGTHKSWELDALDPAVIATLIREAVEGELDWDAWNASKEEEETNRETLSAISGRLADVQAFLAGDDDA